MGLRPKRQKKSRAGYQNASVLLIILIVVGIYPKREPIYGIFVQCFILLLFTTSFIQFACYCNILSLHPEIRVIKEITLVLPLFKSNVLDAE